MAEVRTTFTSDDKEVQKSLAAMQKEMQKYKEELRKAKDEAKSLNDEQEDLLTTTQRSALGMVAGYVSVQGAIAGVTRAIEEMERRGEKARTTQLTAAQAQNAFMFNYLPETPQAASAAAQRVSQIAQQTGLTRSDIYRIATPAVSASTNDEQMWAIVQAAARAKPNNVEDAVALAGGLGDMSNLTGSDDMDANAALLLKATKQARAENLQAVSANLIPGAVGVRARGGTANEAIALVTALTKRSTDRTGAGTATASISLANQLAEALPALGSTDERVRYMIANEDEREKFLSKASIEQKSIAPIEDLLRGGEAFKLYSQYAGSKAGNAGGIIGSIKSLDFQQTENLDRTLGSASARLFEDAPQSARDKILRDRLAEVRSGLGRDWFQLEYAGDLLSQTIDPRETFINTKVAEFTGIDKAMREQQAFGGGDYTQEQQKSVMEVLSVLREISANMAATKANTGKRVNIDGNAE